MPIPYRGRFAPTPSGSLHFGSLVSALASYLDARHHQGSWLIRIEDVDSTRSKKTHETAILNSLAVHGFSSDEPIRYQREHLNDYYNALQTLQPYLYACTCSRRQWHANATYGKLGKVYPRICLNKRVQNIRETQTTLRIELPNSIDKFKDRVYGHCQYDLKEEIGDPILRRRDGDIAYALAVVVDDAIQGITHIVRGKDLIAATSIQHVLQNLLQLPTPSTLHHPLVIGNNGKKLSKQNHAPAINDNTPSKNLISALDFLRQATDGLSENDSVTHILSTAVQRWDVERIKQLASQENDS